VGGSSCLYRPDSDLADLLGFVARVRLPRRLADYPGPVDLRALLALPENQAHTRLWLDGEGELAAYGMVDHFDNVLLGVVHGSDEERITAEILDWAQEAIRIGRAAGPASLDASCRSDDSPRVKVLTEKGFALSGLSTRTLVRSLQDPIPEPILPPGWRIRAYPGRVGAGCAGQAASCGLRHGPPHGGGAPELDAGTPLLESA
jgi:hypothetical protein